MCFTTIVQPYLADRWRKEGHWRSETFFDILSDRAEAHPHREVFADGQDRITYGELKDKVERCAAFLRDIGINRGDVVTIQLPNRIVFPIVFFALELIGAVGNKVNPDFRVRELDYILRFSGSRALICPASFKGFDTSRWHVSCARAFQVSPTWWSRASPSTASGTSSAAWLRPPRSPRRIARV